MSPMLMGELDDEEAARLREIVSSRFHLDAGDAARLVREALESDRGSRWDRSVRHGLKVCWMETDGSRLSR